MAEHPTGAGGGRLTGKIAVVTGGSSGIGRAIVQRFVGEGAQVVVVARKKSDLDQVVREAGAAASGVSADVTAMDDLDRVFAHVKDRFGRLDVIVCSAGTADPGPIDSVTPEEFDHIVGLNLRAPLFTVQKGLPLMQAGGSVILVGSVAGRITLGPSSVYGASKAGLLSYARNWARELGPRGIRVNVLAPGITRTPLVERLISEPEAAARFEDMTLRRIPLGRLGVADEIAAAALFLASDESSYVTAGALYADGGMGQN